MPIDIIKIRSLAQIVREYGLSELTVNDDEGGVSIKRENRITGDFATSDVVNDFDGVSIEPVNAAEKLNQMTVAPDKSFNDVGEIKAPLVGMFYIAPSPGEKPFTAVGAHVKKGDVLCVIEAMKLMNEIAAPENCEIVDICVQNGSLVEYGQTLFKIIA